MLSSFLSSCVDKNETIVHRSFYYWQSEFNLNASEANRIEQLEIEKLYVKFFDVVWDNATQQPIPIAAINFVQIPPKSIEIIPVVFITNETLMKLDENEIELLAFKLNKRIDVLIKDNQIAIPSQIQIDCDWSLITQTKYFLLLTKLQQYPPLKDCVWSATIRLHQIKYFKTTGIPPVDRGMLMFYNMGNIEDHLAKNSIFDPAIAEQYLKSLSLYPLPFDVGIAIYSWGLCFSDNQLIKIIYPLFEQELLQENLFIKQDEVWFEAQQSFYFKGFYFNKGDRIKLEALTPQLSIEASKMLASNLHFDTIDVILYHLDSNTISNFTNENFETVFNHFK